jgi:hypothetical protein
MTKRRYVVRAFGIAGLGGHVSISAGALEKGLPPGWIVDVPLNGLVESFIETAAWFPIQFTLGK